MNPPQKNWYAEIAVAVLVIALIILSVSLVRQYRITARQTMISSERARFASLRQTHSLTAGDISLIAPWMTFGYVSVSFKVPASYLMTALNIPDSTAGYPNITIGRYAHTAATSSTAFAGEVRGAVQKFLVPAAVAPETPAAAPMIPAAPLSATATPPLSQ